ALIYCYGRPIGVSRKIDPEAPIVIQKQWIDSFDHAKGPGELHYDRRTGRFLVPNAGMVYLYDRSDNSGPTAGLGPNPGGERNPDPRRGQPGTPRANPNRAASIDRSVTPTSGPSNPRTVGAPAVARSTGRPTAPTAGARPATARNAA